MFPIDGEGETSEISMKAALVSISCAGSSLVAFTLSLMFSCEILYFSMWVSKSVVFDVFVLCFDARRWLWWILCVLCVLLISKKLVSYTKSILNIWYEIHMRNYGKEYLIKKNKSTHDDLKKIWDTAN